MRIIWGEMKKIWNWKMIAIIGVVCVMFYIMFMSYYVEYYKKGNHPQAELVTYAEELTRRYGTSITPEQVAGFITVERASLATEAEAYFGTMPVFAAAGVYSLDDYMVIQEERWEREMTQAESDAYWTLMGEECGYLGFKLDALRHYEQGYGFRPNASANPDSFYHELSEKEQKRFDESIENGEHLSILSYWTYSNTNDYLKFFSVLLVLSVLILVSPLLVSDRHANLHYLQYSSKYGRAIIRGQLIATLLSAFALTTLLILVFGGIYSQNGTHLFWNNEINSDFNIGMYTVFRLTYGAKVLAAIAMMYALAAGVSSFAFMLSRFSGNLITLVMKLVPVFAALVFLCDAVFNDLFEMLYNKIYLLLRVFGAEAYVSGTIAVIAFAATWFVVRREKRTDVV